MSKTSWVEICVSDLEQSITWFKDVLDFSVVSREADNYAELSCGEMSIHLATKRARHWENEHLLPAGQRGNGVALVLLVDNVSDLYARAKEAQADIVQELIDSPKNVRQFAVRHPDGYLIRPTARFIDGLRPVKETADQLAQQGDYYKAAENYNTMLTRIFEESHLYEEEEDDDEDNSEEQGLGEFVKECIATLGSYLAKNENRDRILEVLFAIYRKDLQDGENNCYELAQCALNQIFAQATPEEYQMLAGWVREVLDTEEGDRHRETYGNLLLKLEKDTLDDEGYLHICRETGRHFELIDRLLTLGRIDQAAAQAQLVNGRTILGLANGQSILDLADLFLQQKQDASAEHLVKKHVKPDLGSLRSLKWLQKFYRERHNRTDELEIVKTIFHVWPTLKQYQEARTVAKQLNCWDTIRQELLTFLEEKGSTTLLIEIALDEEEIDKALELLKKKNEKALSYYAGYNAYSSELAVASAAKKSRPFEAIQIYKQRAERFIGQKSISSYQSACADLQEVKSIYQEIGEQDVWANYILSLRQQFRNLPALKDEMGKSGL